MTKLYELTEKYSQFADYMEEVLSQEEITEEDEELLMQTLESINDEIETKAENIVKFMKNIQSDIDSFKLEEKRLTKKRKALENKHDSLKEYLFMQMNMNKIDNIKAGTFKLKISNSNPSLKIVDESKIPELYRTKQPDAIDKKGLLYDLKLAIKEGKTIQGVDIITDSKHLKIT